MNDSMWIEMYKGSHMIIWAHKSEKVLFVAKWDKRAVCNWGWCTELVKFD